jgi:hypothetical protein
MFSLPGLPKLLLLCLIVWLVWRTIGRVSNVVRRDSDAPSRPQPRNRTADTRTKPGRPQQRAVEDMVQCPKCGAYVPAKGGHDCAGSA